MANTVKHRNGTPFLLISDIPGVTGSNEAVVMCTVAPG